MTTTPSLSLWEAYTMESLRAKGLADKDLFSYLANQDMKGLKSVDKALDYTDLMRAYRQSPAQLKTAIDSQYKIKFPTRNGIKNLLKLKFELEAQLDYTLSETSFIGVPLTKEQLHTVQIMFEPIWKLKVNHQNDEKYNTTIYHASTLLNEQ
ncbi:hypothetical protein [Alkalihalobacillus sp. 1P02AB]|uniref:hypothetical protein n=1 Tax=Alkalihalobacillus sp. 1P02AB TaxID=3132260 RepID=UPI0039A52D1A